MSGPTSCAVSPHRHATSVAPTLRSVVVARDVPEYYAYLREVFRDVGWAHVVIDRRQRAREEGRRPWMIVHADAVEMHAPPARSPWIDTVGAVRLLRWIWSTGWKIGEYAAYQTLPLGRR